MTVIAIAIAYGLVGDIIAATFTLGWPAVTFLTFSLLTWFIGYTIIYRDQLFARLLLFGIAVGFAELVSDHHAVVVTQTLVYAEGGGRILASPIYMPFSWCVLMVQLGYLTWWMTQRWGYALALIVIAVLGGINIPTYEWFAYHADFWFYKDALMLGEVTPYFVILGEVFLVTALPGILRLMARVPMWAVPLVGILQGAWIYLSTRLAYALVG